MTAAPSRAPKLGEDNAPSEFEGEIREFIRRDVAHLRRPPGEGTSEQAVTNINSLLDRVSGSSVSEIDSLITDLRNVRLPANRRRARAARDPELRAALDGRDDLGEDHRREHGTVEDAGERRAARSRLIFGDARRYRVGRPEGLLISPRSGGSFATSRFISRHVMSCT